MRTLHLTSPHMRGQDVSSVQKLLGVEPDGEYGPITAQAVFKKKYWLGYRTPDQTCGDRLVAYLTGQAKPTLAMRLRAAARKKAAAAVPARMKALKVARSFIGTKESPAGSNIVLFSKWYGIIGPWCAMFVSFCLDHVGSKFHYAYVPYVLADARAGRNGLSLLTRETVRRGDLALFDWDDDGEPDHIGFFDQWVGANTFSTVEGNTAQGNDSNGGEVMARTRSVADVAAFVRVHN